MARAREHREFKDRRLLSLPPLAQQRLDGAEGRVTTTTIASTILFTMRMASW